MCMCIYLYYMQIHMVYMSLRRRVLDWNAYFILGLGCGMWVVLRKGRRKEDRKEIT